MKNSLKWQWFYQKRIYLLAFLIPFTIVYLAYMIFGVHPFGKMTVLALDLNAQYVYYYEALRDAIWGDSSVIYSWSRNLSGEMFGIFGYYLASPFMIIPVLLPRSMMCGSVELMQMVKVGAAAVTFAVYLKNQKHFKNHTLLIFSAYYALMAYSIVQLMNPMWLDGLIYLPLIIMGVERLIDNGSMLGCVIPLALMFLAHFYIGYMVGIFTAVYFIYYCFAREDGFQWKVSLKSAGKFTICAIVAVLTAVVIIYPELKSLELGKLDFTDPQMFPPERRFTFIQFLTKLLPFSYDTVRPEGLPVVFCGTMTLLLIPLYYMNKNIKTKNKICNAVLSTIILYCMYLSTSDIAMHGFQKPNWLNYRYSFVFCFVILVITAEAFEHLEGITFRNISATFAGYLIFVIYLESQDIENMKPLISIPGVLVLLCTFFAVLTFVKKKDSNKAKNAALIIVCVELLITSYTSFQQIREDIGYSKFATYKGYIEKGRKITQDIYSEDEGFYRMEKTFHRTVNDNMAFGIRGISHSSSNMNTPVLDFIGKLGFASRGHYTKYNGATKFTDSILGIKYVMTKTKTVYDYEDYAEYDDIKVYKNPTALSIGYMVDNSMVDTHLYYDWNPFMNLNELANSMTGDFSNTDLFKRVFIEKTDTVNITTTNYGDHIKYYPSVEDNYASVTYTLTAQTDDIIYMFLPSHYERQVEVTLNDDISLGKYFETENYCIMPIGRFEPDEKIKITLELKKHDLLMKDQLFYYLDEERFESVMNELKQGNWNITDYSDTYLKGDVTAKSNQILYTTIPYEEGWHIEVDGEEVKPVKLVDCLIGIEVPEGTHTVTMKFFPDYFKYSIFVSLFGVILIVIIGFIDKHSKRILLNKLHS